MVLRAPCRRTHVARKQIRGEMTAVLPFTPCSSNTFNHDTESRNTDREILSLAAAAAARDNHVVRTAFTKREGCFRPGAKTTGKRVRCSVLYSEAWCALRARISAFLCQVRSILRENAIVLSSYPCAAHALRVKLNIVTSAGDSRSCTLNGPPWRAWDFWTKRRSWTS